MERRPRLLLVEPDATPPEIDDCVEDWIRLPAEERDIAARLHALSARSEWHQARPTTDYRRRLVHHGRSVVLSPTEERLATVLVERFGEVVDQAALMEAAWPHAKPSPGTLRVHLTRLRKHLEPIGLEILAVRAFGYVLQARRANSTTTL